MKFYHSTAMHTSYVACVPTSVLYKESSHCGNDHVRCSPNYLAARSTAVTMTRQGLDRTMNATSTYVLCILLFIHYQCTLITSKHDKRQQWTVNNVLSRQSGM